MQISAKDLNQILNGVIEGNPDVKVSKPSKIEEGVEGSICFLANAKYEALAYTTKASILLVSKDFKPSQPIAATLIRVDDVYSSVAVLLKQFGGAIEQEKGVDSMAFVDASVQMDASASVGQFAVVSKGATIGKNTIIYPQVFIGENVKVGDNVKLYPGVKIYKDCEIGNDCIIHSNAIIGSDGFGFAPDANGRYEKIAQIGNVILKDFVEVGANTVIDRATMGSTIIGEGVKLDNLIQIAHNVEVGAHTVMAAQAGIAGSTKIGKHCQIGGQAGFVGHITVADGAKVQAQSGVAATIKKENTAVYGSPAIDYSNYLRSYAHFRNLPDLSKKVRELDKLVRELTKQLNEK